MYERIAENCLSTTRGVVAYIHTGARVAIRIGSDPDPVAAPSPKAARNGSDVCDETETRYTRLTCVRDSLATYVSEYLSLHDFAIFSFDLILLLHVAPSRERIFSYSL